jgi:hypothetical protein
MKIGINHASANFDYTVLALASLEGRSLFFTLNRGAHGAWLEASWLQQPANSALELHWSRRAPGSPAIASNLSSAE